MQKGQAVPACRELGLLGETGEPIAAVTEAQKCYDGNRLGDGIGWEEELGRSVKTVPGGWGAGVRR